MNFFEILLAFGLCVSALNTFAEDAPQSKTAERLLALMNPREIVLSAFTSTLDPMLAQIPQDKQPAVRAAFLRFAESIADSPELQTKMVALYAETFSESELTELLAFYSTPIGMKSLSKMPELMQKGAIIGQEIAQEKQAGLQSELQSIMKAD